MLLNFKSDSFSRYAELIKKILAEDFSYLVATMVYDQSQFPGPPRSVPVEEIKTLFGNKTHHLSIISFIGTGTI